MNPILPEQPHRNATIVILQGRSIPPTPAAIDPTGLAMLEFEFTAEELARALDNGRVRVWVENGPLWPLAPIRVEVIP